MHCFSINQIFCNTCCSQLARFPYLEFKIGRVCKSCTKAIKEGNFLNNFIVICVNLAQMVQHPSES